VTAGFLDEVVEGDQLMETALARATALAEINGEAYGTVKRRLRGAAAKIIADRLA
jgi:enoyl-CoA hydratase/carnithine racemase